ncbi:sigma-54-dependent transcriptional regulator, AcoR family [Syntrophotalea carbinolica DSM 2380]|uniref:Sigma-54-dependent transcriptional regulator, AcoR family n=1 Tax=Syntrophotalea carbinolica (strain DSM 2380 / NBRC 103641 / GraBd1) TaxID=338963 RepID=Q3A7P8_SYNC1|nr:sigma-54-dependent Fis family transcriptional regulator [Syntrophotalea carbinolica]ABA87596.1 sigma-54-dependent transcriptional regulator, AcoR family [Syntrophotalea carbinolica DSM 2380]
MPEQEVNRHIQRIFSCVSGNRGNEGQQIEAPIVTSWERSLQHYGIDPSEPNPVQVLTAAELREYTRPIERFLRIAKAGVQFLHRQVADLGYSTLLCDAHGVTVDWRGDERFSRQWKDAGLYLGAVWNEHQEGTCGVGTALIEQTALTVHKGDHFRAKNANLTCSCAPIIGPSGKTMGLIDVSALHSPDSKESQHLALQLVMQSARMIESAYFLNQYEDQWVLKLNFERELAEVSSECLVAIDGEGRILAADRIACRTLGHEVPGGNLVGRFVREVFDLNFEKLLDVYSNSSMVLPIRTQATGLQLFACLRSPQAISVKPVGRVEPVAPPRRQVPLAGQPLTLDYLAGDDRKLQDSVERIKRVMNKPIPILLNGETGTGKEMFAQAIHHASRRADKPFVAVNCAAIPESLIESELFGYKDGAFTGARSKGMRGKILQSDGGTLFLDEIGDMPASLQPRLLRVLAEREVTPLGGETAIPVDLHVICATHRNILDMVASGAFREDLYYRLNGIAFELPSLRERSDLERLINDVLLIEAGNSVESVVIDDAAMRVMTDFCWPGNIRQLRNALRYALAVCDNGVITCADLPVDITVTGSTDPAAASLTASRRQPVAQLPEEPVRPPAASVVDEAVAGLNAMEQAERQVILEALQKYKWQVSKAVKEVGISRATMYRKMDKYAIVPPNKR